MIDHHRLSNDRWAVRLQDFYSDFPDEVVTSGAHLTFGKMHKSIVGLLDCVPRKRNCVPRKLLAVMSARSSFFLSPKWKIRSTDNRWAGGGDDEGGVLRLPRRTRLVARAPKSHFFARSAGVSSKVADSKPK